MRLAALPPTPMRAPASEHGSALREEEHTQDQAQQQGEQRNARQRSLWRRGAARRTGMRLTGVAGMQQPPLALLLPNAAELRTGSTGGEVPRGEARRCCSRSWASCGSGEVALSAWVIESSSSRSHSASSRWSPLHRGVKNGSSWYLAHSMRGSLLLLRVRCSNL